MGHSGWHTTLACPRCIHGTQQVAHIVIVPLIYKWHTTGGTRPYCVLDVYMTQRVAHNLGVSSMYTWHAASGTCRYCVLDVYMARSEWHMLLSCPRCVHGTQRVAHNRIVSSITHGTQQVAHNVVVSSMCTWHTAGGAQPWRVLDVYMARSRCHMSLLCPRCVNDTQRVAHNLIVSSMCSLHGSQTADGTHIPPGTPINICTFVPLWHQASYLGVE